LARVFISYTHTDREFAARLAVDLTRAAVNVWYDQWEVAPGDSIVEKINNALRWNDYLVIVLSPEAIQSRWVAREINSSLLQSLEGRSVTLIPVLKEQCILPVLIADLHYADFTQSYDSGFGALLAKFENISQVPAYSVQARKVTDLDIAAPGGPVKTLFPKSFADWPRCVLGEQGQLDILIILGSTGREKSGDSSEFAKGQIETDVFGIRWRFSRQESPGTTRDAVRAVDLAAYLGAAQLKQQVGSRGVPWPGDSICTLDVSVTQDQLTRNIILVGAADTNLFYGLAAVAYRQRFGYSVPIRYSGDEHLYFTCDQIVSDLSSQTYSRLEESGGMHCGYIAIVPNPWSPTKVMILASGTRATGTQAALLALTKGYDEVAAQAENAEAWHWLAGNNRYNSGVPAKIVRASRAVVAVGSDYLAPSREIKVSPYDRISQRHIVTDFEFLE
jgi:TIR domain